LTAGPPRSAEKRKRKPTACRRGSTNPRILAKQNELGFEIASDGEFRRRNFIATSFPPTIDFELAKGFGIYKIKAMLNGKGDEILDLTATNLRAFF